MRKITLFLMSLFLTVGAMAQNYDFEVIDIASNADEMLYSNAPCTVTTWGDDFKGWDVLFDDNTNTIFHSEYGSGTSVDGLDHYLRVDMGENNELSTFKFTFTTRDKNCEVNSPTTMVVEGSNEANGTYTVIKTITGIPQQNSYKYESDVLGQAGVAYRYIRFRVTATGSNQTDGGGKKFFFIAEFGMSKATPAARTEYVHNTGNLNRNDRGLTAFTITDGKNSLEVTGIQTTSTAPVYVDKSAQKLTTYAGATLSFSAFSYTGAWMHAYAYVDYNKDYGFTLTNNNAGTNDGEIVSYNYYDGKTITGTNGSQSDAMTSEHNGSKTLPAFTLPSNLEPGEYRMRIKVDWNNLDADYGASDIAANGGAQCDITLVVEAVEGNEVAKERLAAKIAEATNLFNAVTVGEGVGKYSGLYSAGDLESVMGSINNFYNSITPETEIATIEGYITMIDEAIASYSLNMPVAGKYYAFVQNNNYITSNVANSKIACSETMDASAIYYYDGSHLLAYATGLYFGLNETDWTFEAVGSNDISAIEFIAAANGAVGKYNIKAVNRWLHLSANTDGSTFVNRCSNNTCAEHNWEIVEVVELPVTISAAGYATFYAPVAVNVPNGVKAYTVTIKDKWATLNEITSGVIPENTGVVLEGDADTYNFAISEDNTVYENNVLRGTVEATYINDDAYVLGYINVAEEGQPEKMEVGFYTATKNQQENTSWKNNGHKAYLPKTAGMNAASYSFRFGGETTGVENVVVENEVKAIYDLTGRRVEAITAPGIYIVGGKKVLVK